MEPLDAGITPGLEDLDDIIAQYNELVQTIDTLEADRLALRNIVLERVRGQEQTIACSDGTTVRYNPETTRASLDKKKLVQLGVTLEQIQGATVPSPVKESVTITPVKAAAPAKN